MSQQVDDLKRMTRMGLEESGIRSEDINLDYITEDSYQELTVDALPISDVVRSDAYQKLMAETPRLSDGNSPDSINTVSYGFNLVWESDRLVYNYLCGYPSRAFVMRDYFISSVLNGGNCRGVAEYTIVSR